MYRRRRPYLLYFCNHTVLAIACIDNHMCTVLFGHGKAFVSSIDTNDIEAERSCKLDAEMTETTSRPDYGKPFTTLEISLQYTFPDRSASTCKRCCTLKRHLIWDWS